METAFLASLNSPRLSTGAVGVMIIPYRLGKGIEEG